MQQSRVSIAAPLLHLTGPPFYRLIHSSNKYHIISYHIMSCHVMSCHIYLSEFAATARCTKVAKFGRFLRVLRNSKLTLAAPSKPRVTEHIMWTCHLHRLASFEHIGKESESFPCGKLIASCTELHGGDVDDIQLSYVFIDRDSVSQDTHFCSKQPF